MIYRSYDYNIINIFSKYNSNFLVFKILNIYYIAFI